MDTSRKGICAATATADDGKRHDGATTGDHLAAYERVLEAGVECACQGRRVTVALRQQAVGGRGDGGQDGQPERTADLLRGVDQSTPWINWTVAVKTNQGPDNGHL